MPPLLIWIGPLKVAPESQFCPITDKYWVKISNTAVLKHHERTVGTIILFRNHIMELPRICLDKPREAEARYLALSQRSTLTDVVAFTLACKPAERVRPIE